MFSMKSLATILFFVISGSVADLAGVVPGNLVSTVACEAEPQYSYALYLPSNYDPDRSWPLILAYDPSGVGSRPVEGLRAAADRYGYIVAGSNDSRNYTSWEFKLAAAGAVWRDVAGRFSIDPRRVYTTGFSGGARMATEVALKTQAVAGVLAVGGSFRARETIDGPIPFVLLGVSGTRDMNHREMQQAHAKLLEREHPTRHLIFNGPHQWPPEDTFTAAVEWFEVQAMRRELRPRDPARLATLLEQAVTIAQAHETRGAPYAALTCYEQIARDFAGLIDLGGVPGAIDRLRGDPAVRNDRQEDQRWIRFEDRARARLATQMRKMEAAIDDTTGRSNDLRTLRRELDGAARDETSENGPRAAAAARLVAFVSTVGFERAIVASQNGDYARAALFYEIALQAAPDSDRLRVRLAGTYARLARFERALETLSEAVALGFADTDRLRTDENFEALGDDPRFAALLAEMDERSVSP